MKNEGFIGHCVCLLHCACLWQCTSATGHWKSLASIASDERQPTATEWHWIKKFFECQSEFKNEVSLFNTFTKRLGFLCSSAERMPRMYLRNFMLISGKSFKGPAYPNSLPCNFAHRLCPRHETICRKIAHFGFALLSTNYACVAQNIEQKSRRQKRISIDWRERATK